MLLFYIAKWELSLRDLKRVMTCFLMVDADTLTTQKILLILLMDFGLIQNILILSATFFVGISIHLVSSCLNISAKFCFIYTWREKLNTQNHTSSSRLILRLFLKSQLLLQVHLILLHISQALTGYFCIALHLLQATRSGPELILIFI